MNDYSPVLADDKLEEQTRSLVRLAIHEDLDIAHDWTTVCLVDEGLRGGCEIIPREPGIAAGLAVLPWVVGEFDADLGIETLIEDGQRLVPGQPIARVTGNVRDLLTAERVILNVLSRLCGVASLTGRYIERLGDARARLYDTRKTTPGWRRLEKYAVRCGGGHNHRAGLYDGFLIKDNHLAFAHAGGARGTGAGGLGAGGLGAGGGRPLSAREATERAIGWRGSRCDSLVAPSIVEVEVDSLAQLADVLPAGPDIVLVDNFGVDQIREAVRMRDELNPEVELEASGNVTIDTIAGIAATGVDRISCGALTHQATWIDLGFDWFDASPS